MPILLALALAGCAGTPGPAVEPAASAGPEPVPRDQGPVGVLHVVLAAQVSEAAPAEVRVDLEVRPTNAIGQPLPARVSWNLSVEDAPGTLRSGQGLRAVHAFTLERGVHQVVATASADGFRPATAMAEVEVLPPPLEAHVMAPGNATRGVWVNVTGQALNGYADVAFRCRWDTPPEVRIEDEDACATRARWLEEGNQTLGLAVDDGHSQAASLAAVRVLPVVPAPFPTAAPAQPDLVDGDDAAVVLPHVNITAGWFHSDIEHLYVGLAVESVPDAAAMRESTYRVSFTPSWNATDAGGVAYTRWRVVADHPFVDGTSPGSPGMHLEASGGDAWIRVGDVHGRAEAGILWWRVARDAMQAPVEGASISQFLAEAGPEGAPQAWDEASAAGPYALA